MTTDVHMNLDERRKYLMRMQPRYQKADRAGRHHLLNEMTQVTELHRKSLIRLMGQDLARQPRQRQRSRAYDREVGDAVRIIAETLDYICAQRLTPSLLDTAELLARHGELQLNDQLRQQLGKISVSTVKRILKRARQDERRRLPRHGPERALQVRREVPARRIPWDTQEPGHFELDTVHHCGRGTHGDYVHTLQMIDVATGWSERVAVLGRSVLVMQAGFERILARLPFPILELHPDNGSELLNQHLLRFFKGQAPGVRFSRSRPWKKDDNRFVEQKNQTLVRAYLGHDRLDSVAQTGAVNQLYEKMWLYYNLFQPVLRITAKTVQDTPGQRPRIQRHYDTARTPFDRLCATGVLSAAEQEELEALRQQTNPRRLRKEIYQRIYAISALPCAGEVQNVYLTFGAAEQPAQGCGRAVDKWTTRNDGLPTYPPPPLQLLSSRKEGSR